MSEDLVRAPSPLHLAARQTIDTAPKDGTWICFWEGDVAYVGRWAPVAYQRDMSDADLCRPARVIYGWKRKDVSGERHPSHWEPLSAPHDQPNRRALSSCARDGATPQSPPPPPIKEPEMSEPLKTAPEERAAYLEEARAAWVKAKDSSGYSLAATWAIAHGLRLIDLATLNATHPATSEPADEAVRSALELAYHALTGIVGSAKKTVGGWEKCDLTDFDFARTALTEVSAALSRGEADSHQPGKCLMCNDTKVYTGTNPDTGEIWEDPCAACYEPRRAPHHPSAGAPSREADEPIGYLFLNPDTGVEFSESHPIISGEVTDAQDIRPATAENLLDELGRAWDQLAEYRALYATPPGEGEEDHSSVGKAELRSSCLPPTDETGGGSDERGGWHRDQNLLYTLEQDGWYRGKPVMVNRLMVKVERSHSVPAEEVNALTDHLHALLSAASVAPEARATAQTSPDGEGAHEGCEATEKPTEPSASTLSAMGEGWRLDEGVLQEALERAFRDCRGLVTMPRPAAVNMLGRSMLKHIPEVEAEFAAPPAQAEGGE